jgi:hypothetical protein
LYSPFDPRAEAQSKGTYGSPYDRCPVLGCRWHWLRNLQMPRPESLQSRVRSDCRSCSDLAILSLRLYLGLRPALSTYPVFAWYTSPSQGLPDFLPGPGKPGPERVRVRSVPSPSDMPWAWVCYRAWPGGGLTYFLRSAGIQRLLN